ncbi:hypothetical protein QE152_g33348 [Popillia japonica]|uniref:Uncharacterized protein n=1 Tax=Popillia japonica TaxID=7064 RepID=A0AAW1IX02_POPJA
MPLGCWEQVSATATPGYVGCGSGWGAIWAWPNAAHRNEVGCEVLFVLDLPVSVCFGSLWPNAAHRNEVGCEVLFVLDLPVSVCFGSLALYEMLFLYIAMVVST